MRAFSFPNLRSCQRRHAPATYKQAKSLNGQAAAEARFLLAAPASEDLTCVCERGSPLCGRECWRVVHPIILPQED